ncbi:hypothetical protein D3C81_1764050 [compost metagenome]
MDAGAGKGMFGFAQAGHGFAAHSQGNQGQVLSGMVSAEKSIQVGDIKTVVRDAVPQNQDFRANRQPVLLVHPCRHVEPPSKADSVE